MKKKKLAALSLAALVAGTGAFHAYSSYQQSGESDALLNENILALSSESEGGPFSICYYGPATPTRYLCCPYVSGSTCKCPSKYR